MRLLARVLFALACAGTAAIAPAAVSVVDDDGRVVTLAAPARRIVSLAPHATELLFALDAGSREFGAKPPSEWPPAARSLPQRDVRLRGFFGEEGEAAVQAFHGMGKGGVSEEVPAEPGGINDAAQDIERHPQ